MRYGLLSRKFGQKEAESAENPTEKKKAREQRIKYFTLMVYEDADATLLRLFECFMESAPQLILQVKIRPPHCLYRILDSKKLAASNLVFQAFKRFIGT